jgi:hypothetical protein
MMDRAGSYRSDRHHNIRKVNGECPPSIQAELKITYAARKPKRQGS